MKTPVRQRKASVCLGKSALPVGELAYSKDGSRESSSFAYAASWLASAMRFEISPDLPLIQGHQYHRAPNKDDSVFHFCFADTEPDGWGCRVIARDHAKRRRKALSMGQLSNHVALTEMDYLLGVDDVSRIGALRLLDDQGRFLRTIEDDGRGTPPLIELSHLISASRAVEMGQETEADLRYLRGRGTSVGGMRPKCSVIDDDGKLSIGKFPSVKDDRSVTRGEVLALHLADAAGINAAHSRVVMSDEVPVALVRRFDRVSGGGRLPYLSAASLLQATRQDDYAYAQIADQILAMSVDPLRDLAELWRRLVFNLLIINVDDHLQNHGFLHVGHGQWRLAPAFDINPFPDKDPELKLWLTEDSGPANSITEAVAEANYFRLSRRQALAILAQVLHAVQNWRAIATIPAVGMSARDLEDFEPAFVHPLVEEAASLLRG